VAFAVYIDYHWLVLYTLYVATRAVRAKTSNPEAPTIRVADETLLAVALLHRENPDRADFSIAEIVERAARENITGHLRPGVQWHASLHGVANMAPNPARLRMLYATREGRRRLLNPNDDVHPGRTGKIFPNPDDVPEKYGELIEWAKQRYGEENRGERWLEGIFQLQGLGKEIWRGVDPDEYVRELREGWD
jgi:hypothetical protein